MQPPPPVAGRSRQLAGQPVGVGERHLLAARVDQEVERVDRAHVDGELDAIRPVRAQVCSVIRRLRPTVVLGHDPWKRYRLHPDHRAAGQLCIDGIVAARDPFFHPEQLVEGVTPHRPEALLLFEPDEINHHEAVDEQDVAAKLAALEAHTTQMETTHFYKVGDGDPLTGFRDGQRARLAAAGAAAGVPLAEAYHLIVDQL